jgi:glycosyltransferase involved in cell wall biosynthesis
MKPRVSILLPVFNAEPTLPECLDSLLAQKFSDFEIIAVDDGSTDGTADILLEYSRKDSRIRMINTEHSGIVTTLNAAYRYAQAPYIARMDADDISLPERLTKQVELLDDRSDIAVCGCLVGPIPGITLGAGYEEYFRWINDLTEPEEIGLNIYVESPMPHPTVMFRRGPYEQVGGYQDHRWPEDYDLWLRMHLAEFKFAKVPDVLVQWRDHPNRFSRRNPRYDIDAFFRAKANYLAQGPLRGVEEVVVWGAGKTSRRRSEYLKEYGIRIIAYIDVDPNKIGNSVRGVPVVGPEDIEKYPGHLILPFVQARGARADIRRKLAETGRVEGKDFICCA